MRFQIRWIPSDMMSFITSYCAGNAVEHTARTRFFFSSFLTERKPKSVSSVSYVSRSGGGRKRVVGHGFPLYPALLAMPELPEVETVMRGMSR
jgi:hypothetical protein